MSKFCPFCDDVKDSELDSPEALKEHLSEEHQDEVVEGGDPRRPDQMDAKPDPNPVQAEYKEINNE